MLSLVRSVLISVKNASRLYSGDLSFNGVMLLVESRRTIRVFDILDALLSFESFGDLLEPELCDPYSRPPLIGPKRR